MSKFDQMLKEMKELHDSKKGDYSHGGEWDNFELTAQIAGLTVEEVFLSQIGNKMARLKSLRKKNGPPNYESLQDTRKDLANYSTMYAAYFLDEPEL